MSYADAIQEGRVRQLRMKKHNRLWKVSFIVLRKWMIKIC